MQPQDRPSDYDPYAWQNNPPGARAEIVRMVRRLPPTGVWAWSDDLPIVERESGKWIRNATRSELEDRCIGTCAEPECDQTWDLEMDHIVPLSQNGRHALDNMQLLCPTHHKAKTATERREVRQHAV